MSPETWPSKNFGFAQRDRTRLCAIDSPETNKLLRQKYHTKYNDHTK